MLSQDISNDRLEYLHNFYIRIMPNSKNENMIGSDQFLVTTRNSQLLENAIAFTNLWL